MAQVSPKRRRKSVARFYAVQALFQMEAVGTDLDIIQGEFETHRFGATLDEGELEDGDPKHFRTVIRAAINRQAEIDQQIDRSLEAKWPIKRIDPTIRAILRACLGEFLETDTPPKVALAEYIEITRAFFPDSKEPGFVNAVLDHATKALNPDAFT